MSILHERSQWNAANSSEREAVISEFLQAAPNFAARYQFQGIKMFSCTGIENHVAIFKDQQTGMCYHLLPGDSTYVHGLTQGQHEEVTDDYSMDLPEWYGERVRVKPFLISEYLITEHGWGKFSSTKLHFNFGRQHPIDAVDRNDVKRWASKAGQRLPSEVEWEYACKAGTNTLFYWGNEPDLDYAWTKDNQPDSADYTNLPADQQKAPNAFGLLGMIGNLGEWVADDMNDDTDADFYQTAYKNDEAEYEVDGILRGGWHEYDWDFNRSTSRIASACGDTGCSARAVIDWAEIESSAPSLKKPWWKVW